MQNLQFSTGDSAFTVCPHCKGKIIVPSVAVHSLELEEPQYPDGRTYLPDNGEPQINRQPNKLQKNLKKQPSRIDKKSQKPKKNPIVTLIIYAVIGIALYYWFNS